MIYIFSPVNAITGGVELLQQLGYKLNRINEDAEIVYLPTGFKNNFTYKNYSTPDVYKKYGVCNAYEFEDSINNIAVVPETLAWKLSEIRNANKFLWWLSIDFFKYANNKLFTKVRMSLKRIDITAEDITHLVQSYYASEWLKKQGVKEKNILFLSDYLRSDFIQEASREQEKDKKQQILYNPRKGLNFTQKIIARTQYEAIPLKGYTPEEMVNLLQESMVYIDFGNHPGKDRIPREAAISGCCIITGKQGAAKNDIDIPISKRFKFEDNEESIEAIVDCIDMLMRNYPVIRNEYDLYRESIRGEEMIFDRQIKEIFVKRQINRGQ